MFQIITAAVNHGRKVVLVGRSIDQSVQVARGLGYLPFDDDEFVKDEDAERYPQKNLVYIIAGCYGQQGSALDRLARGEHQHITLEENALVIFSADPNPPGVAEAVERLMDTLTLKGAEVVYSKIQENLHVSGHGTKGDLVEIASIVRPKYFIPIGGTATRARAYANLMVSLGFQKSQVFELLEGDSVIFNEAEAHKGDRLSLKQVLVEGKNASGVVPVVIQDRETLSNDGVFVVIVPISKSDKSLAGNVDVVTRGFVYVKESQALIGQSRDVVNKSIDKHKDLVGNDWGALKKKIENEVGRFLKKQTGKQPMVIVHNLEI
jgi:ribonuclease J